mgnify:CR=1 FL=1
MLNVYSCTRDGETLLSRSFRAKEFACKDGTDFVCGQRTGAGAAGHP